VTDSTGVIFVNPASGPDDTDLEELRQVFRGHRVEECAPADLAEAVRKAVHEGVAFVGIAGGDGSISAGAHELVNTGVPLLAVPAGTRNHFARDVGTGAWEDAIAAVGPSGRVREIDVGQVNGRTFVNNSSIGLYPKIVVRREAGQQRLPKGVANLVAGWEQLRHGHRMRVEVDGEPHAAWLVFVGNGIYGDGLLDLGDRQTLDEHVLDVRVVRADRPLARLRIVGAVLLGRLARSPLVIRMRCRVCTLDPRGSKVEVALDGEVQHLPTPLRYESLSGALRVLAPADPDAAEV
jgi:undecaprenyl-diphosphatase